MRPAHPGAPELPQKLREKLSEGDVVALQVVPGARGDRLQIAMRMPWQTGPCAVLLLERKAGARQLAGPSITR